jgi:hypothetical protein
MEQTQGERGGGGEGGNAGCSRRTEWERGVVGDPFSFLLNLYYNISKNLLKE